MDQERIDRVDEFYQESATEGIRLEQSTRRGLRRDRVTYLFTATCIVTVVFLGAELGSFPAFGDDSLPSATPSPQVSQGGFEYSFPSPGTGTVTDGPPITFSHVSLHNVSQGPAIGNMTLFGPFPNSAPDHFISFSVFAPPGYLIDVNRESLFVSTVQAGASFAVSRPETSQEIEVRFGHNPAVSDTLPLGSLVGDFTIREITIRYYPRAGFSDRMVGGVFEGTNGDPVSGPYTTIHTIWTNPPQAWSSVSANLGNFHYLRYRGPNGSAGNVAEIEFYRNGTKLTGTAFGTSGSWNNAGNTFDKALDGDVNTFFDAPIDSGAYVGIDTIGTGPSFVRFGYGFPFPGRGWISYGAPIANGIIFSGVSLHNVFEGSSTSLGTLFGPWPAYPPGFAPGWPNNPSDPYIAFTVSAPVGYQVDVDRGSLAAATIQGGDRSEVSGPGTSVQIKVGFVHFGPNDYLPLSGMTGSLTLRQVVPGIDTILYYPRAGWSERMVGGVFEGTNGDPVKGPYTTIHSITTNPPQGWSSAGVSLGNYRYLRYRGPTGSFGNVAEIQFYRNGMLLTGPGYGTPGSWNNSGASFDKALDGDVKTFFDAPSDTAYVGVDTGGTGPDTIRYYPRAGWTERMVGGVFEGTDADPVNGPYTTFYTITVNPPQAWSQASVSLGSYRYLRYRGPNGSYGNVSELEFYRSGVKVTGVGFGTPGSWDNGGATFDRALDRNVNTYFDAPTGNEAYVGIDTAATPVGPFTLTVESGSGSGQYPTGATVTITADEPAYSALQFAQWIGINRLEDTNTLGDPFISSTTVTMPPRDVRIAATYGATSYLADTIRYYPRAGFTERMVGGVFEGTNGDPVNGPYSTIYTIRESPPLKWSLVGGVSFANYQYLRYRGPDGSYGNVADIAFARNGMKLAGTGYGTLGSWNDGGNTFANALDADISTSFDGPTPNGCYVGINTGAALPEVFALTVNKGSGTGSYSKGALVQVSADASPFGQKFAGWTGDIAILSNPLIPRTTATIPGMDVAISASYSAVTGSDRIRYYPRTGWTERMVGGVFEGTNEDPVTGPYATIYTITTNPPLAWSEIDVSLGNFRYLRYRGPNGSYGNVSEIEFYRSGVKVTGADFGTSGSWSNSGSTRDKAVDGSVDTFFDAPMDSDAYVGIDTQ